MILVLDICVTQKKKNDRRPVLDICVTKKNQKDHRRHGGQVLDICVTKKKQKKEDRGQVLDMCVTKLKKGSPPWRPGMNRSITHLCHSFRHLCDPKKKQGTVVYMSAEGKVVERYEGQWTQGVLQCVAVCCRVLQCVAVCCSERYEGL